jgi:hypothetical protein
LHGAVAAATCGECGVARATHAATVIAKSRKTRAVNESGLS